jgi:hypothetical protein
VIVPLKRYFEENGAPEKRHSYVLCVSCCPLHTYIPLFYNSLMYLEYFLYYTNHYFLRYILRYTIIREVVPYGHVQHPNQERQA